MDVQNLFTTAVLPAIPGWLKAFLGVSFVAAFMGTIDSAAFAFGSVFSKAFFKNDSKKYIQIATFVGILFASFLSVTSMGILSVVFAFIALVAVVGAAFVFSGVFNWTSKEVNMFLTISVIVFILGQIFKFVTDDPITSIYPIASGLVCVLVYKIISKKI
jgi:Na+/proline symporter